MVELEEGRPRLTAVVGATTMRGVGAATFAALAIILASCRNDDTPAGSRASMACRSTVDVHDDDTEATQSDVETPRSDVTAPSSSCDPTSTLGCFAAPWLMEAQDSSLTVFTTTRDLVGFDCKGSTFYSRSYPPPSSNPQVQFGVGVTPDPWLQGFRIEPLGDLKHATSLDDPSYNEVLLRHTGRSWAALDTGISYPDFISRRYGYVDYGPWTCVGHEVGGGSDCYPSDFEPDSRPAPGPIRGLFHSPDASWGIGVQQRANELDYPYSAPGYVVSANPAGSTDAAFQIEAIAIFPVLLSDGFVYLPKHDVYIFPAVARNPVADSSQDLHIVSRDGGVETITGVQDGLISLDPGLLDDDTIHLTGFNVNIFHYPTRKLTLVDEGHTTVFTGTSTIQYSCLRDRDGAGPPPPTTEEFPLAFRETWIRADGNGSYERIINKWGILGSVSTFHQDRIYTFSPLNPNQFPSETEAGARWGLWRTDLDGTETLLAITARHLYPMSDGVGLFAMGVTEQVVYELDLRAEHAPTIRGPLVRGALSIGDGSSRCGDCTRMRLYAPNFDGKVEQRDVMPEGFSWWPSYLPHLGITPIVVCRFPPPEALGLPPGSDEDEAGVEP